jgi:peptidoglycan/xylan/chitin deacetylase (PgdA/CDA1 family)
VRAILMYHSIDASGSPISIPESAFRAHVAFLSSGRIRVLPIEELVTSPDDDDAVALTFDDGFSSFASIAAPLLQRHGLPATVFVVSDAAGGTNAWGGRDVPGIPTLPLMNWTMIGEVAAAGFEIGAHTRTHPDLTTVVQSRLEDELSGSIERINTETGRRPDRFAYPYGAVNDTVATAARGMFRHSCTTELHGLSSGDDRALLPRLDAYYFREAGQLEAWGTPQFRSRVWLRAQGRRVRALMTAGNR